MVVPVPVGANARISSNYQPDEASHIAVIRFLATRRTLPPYERPYDTSVHPPLYHGLAALVYVLLKPAVREERIFLAIRLLTALCGVGVVYLTYRTGREVGPRSGALLAAALVALVPMRASIGGGISNENLAALGAAGTLAVLAGGWFDFRRGFSTFGRIALLCAYLIAGIGSKVTCLGLIPIAAAAIVCEARQRHRPLLPALLRATLVAAAPIAAWGWWFARNRALYGDWFRQAAADRLWDSVQPGFAAQHATTGVSAVHYIQMLTMRSYLSFWGIFDGFRAMIPWSMYALLAAFQIACFFGLTRMAAGSRNRPVSRPPCPPILGGSDTISVSKSRSSGSEPPRIGGQGGLLTGRSTAFAAFAATLIAYSAFVAAVFYRYNWSHFSPQGRYYFVLLLPFGIVTALGWNGLWRQPTVQNRNRAAIGILLLLLLLNLWCLWSVPQQLSRHGMS